MVPVTKGDASVYCIAAASIIAKVPSPSPSPGPGPGPNQALLRLATGLDRQQTAPAAPPEGLCLSRVGYGAYSAGDSE